MYVLKGEKNQLVLARSQFQNMEISQTFSCCIRYNEQWDIKNIEKEELGDQVLYL